MDMRITPPKHRSNRSPRSKQVKDPENFTPPPKSKFRMFTGGATTPSLGSHLPRMSRPRYKF